MITLKCLIFIYNVIFSEVYENPWVQYFDDEGVSYWYNTQTGVSQYEYPNE